MASDGIEISVVLPCLNEEAAIGAVVDRAREGIAATRRPGEVIVVDNGSTDHSAGIAAEHGARVVREPRRGYGSAYLAGLAAARGEFIVMGDADQTYDLGQLAPLVEALESGHDLVMGSRLRGTIHAGAMPWAHRWIGNPLLTGVLNRLFGVRVSDAHCGLRALRRSVLPILRLQALGMEFATEMVVKAGKHGLRITEVPIEYFPRTGESKLNRWRDGWRHLRFMLVHSPTFLFLVPGSIVLLIGLVALLPLVGGPVHVFGRTWQIHTMIVGSTATIVGAQIIQLGLFARTYALLYLGDREPTLERLWLRIRLEHGILLGGALFLGGFGLLLGIFVEWVSSGLGRLEAKHPAVFGLTLVALGAQTIFGSFFLSILGLRKHLLLAPDERPADEADSRDASWDADDRAPAAAASAAEAASGRGA